MNRDQHSDNYKAVREVSIAACGVPLSGYLLVAHDARNNSVYWGGSFPPTLAESKRMIARLKTIEKDLREWMRRLDTEEVPS